MYIENPKNFIMEAFMFMTLIIAILADRLVSEENGIKYCVTAWVVFWGIFLILPLFRSCGCT